MADWHVTYEKVVPYIVRIETPEGFGTGFLFASNESNSIVAFATAAHVVGHADSWNLPIKLRHDSSGNEVFLPEEKRIIALDHARDSASILLSRPGDYLPDNVLQMVDSDHFIKVGVDVAWAGYPAIASPNLCLFTGTIAAFVAHDDSYLIDGVAINGVSGGPVFTPLPGGEPQLLGTISAYMPNRQRGDALPGILQAHDVTAFHEAIKTIQSLDDARQKKEQDDRARRQAEAAGDAPADEPAPGEPDA